MRKDKPYIDKKGRAVGHRLFFAVLCLCLPLMSCTNDEATLPDKDDSCRVTLRLDVSSFGQQDAGITRSVAGNSDENLIKDIWVFQFSKQTGTLLKEAVYLNLSDGNTDDIEVDFVQSGANESSIVCVVGNTHDASWAYDANKLTKEAFRTYEGLQEQSLPDEVSKPFLSSKMGENEGYTIPMYGESAEMVIASKTYIRVPLVRMFAKVDVYVDPSYPHEMDMSINQITYSSIPLYSRVKAIEGSDEYPTDIAWIEFEAGKADEYILYIPENMQGTVDEMDDKKEDGRVNPDLFPEKALAIHIDMKHTVGEGDDAESHIHPYTVYPGMDMTNDFNIKRNYIYNVIIKITSDPSTDPTIPILP